MPTKNKDNHSDSILDRIFETSLELLSKWHTTNAAFEIPADIENRQAVYRLIDCLFREMGFIDWSLGQFCNIKKSNRGLGDLLRLGACRVLRSQELIPDPVIVNSIVRIARHRFSSREAGFANAVLRKLVREKKTLIATQPSALPPEARFNINSELFDQWRSHLTENEIAGLEEILKQRPPFLVRKRRSPENTPTPSLYPESISLHELPPFSWTNERFFECPKPREFIASTPFNQNVYYIQDPATLLSVEVLAPLEKEIIGDFCAAPGGKSILIEERLGEEGFLVSSDRDLQRLVRLKHNLSSSEKVGIISADAIRPPFRHASFNAILLDVPCSNTGVIRHRPDVRWRFSKASLKRLKKIQRRILTGCVPLIKPGSRIVYSTCSIEPEENHDQIHRFLTEFPQFTLKKEKQLLPDEWHDGAYVALLAKEE